MENKTITIEDESWMELPYEQLYAFTITEALDSIDNIRDLTHYGIAVKVVENLIKKGYSLVKIID